MNNNRYAFQLSDTFIIMMDFASGGDLKWYILFVLFLYIIVKYKINSK